MGDDTSGGAGWMSILKGLFGGNNASNLAGQADPNLISTYFGSPTISPTGAAPGVGDDGAGAFSSIIDPQGASGSNNGAGMSTDALMKSITGGASYDPSAPSADSKTAPTMGQTATSAAKKFGASADTLAKLATKPPSVQAFQAPSGGSGDSGKTMTPNNVQIPSFTPGQRLTLSQLIYGR